VNSSIIFVSHYSLEVPTSQYNHNYKSQYMKLFH